MLTKEQFIDNLKKTRAISKEISKKYKDELQERYQEHEVSYDLDNPENLCVAITDYICYGILPKHKTLDDIWDAFQALAKKENWDIPDMKVSYDSEDLIEDCLDDMSLLGEDFMVYAKHQSFYNDSCEFIVGYVAADRPTREEIIGFNAMDDEEDYQAMLKEYEEGIESLKGYRKEKMTLQALLSRLEQQNTIF